MSLKVFLIKTKPPARQSPGMGANMKHGTISRKEAIEIVGLEMVEKVDKENCDFTNRIQTDGDTSVEFSSSVQGEDLNGDDCTLVAYYYQDQDDIDEAGDDLGNLDWEVEGYEIY